MYEVDYRGQPGSIQSDLSQHNAGNAQERFSDRAVLVCLIGENPVPRQAGHSTSAALGFAPAMAASVVTDKLAWVPYSTVQQAMPVSIGDNLTKHQTAPRAV